MLAGKVGSGSDPQLGRWICKQPRIQRVLQDLGVAAVYSARQSPSTVILDRARQSAMEKRRLYQLV